MACSPVSFHSGRSLLQEPKQLGMKRAQWLEDQRRFGPVSVEWSAHSCSYRHIICILDPCCARASVFIDLGFNVMLLAL
jgi:hypothetical protein